MRKTIILLTILMVICSITGRAQEKAKKNQLGFSLGAIRTINQDYLMSPFTYKSTSFQPGITYHHSGRKNRQTALLEMTGSTMKSAISGQLGHGSHQNELIAIHANYSYYQFIFSPDYSKLKLFAGPEISIMFTIRNYDFGSGIANETIGEVFSSLGAGCLLEYSLKQDIVISYSTALSIYSFAYRNPYSPTDEEGDMGTKNSYFGAYTTLGDWQGLSEFVYWDNNLFLNKSVSKRFALNVCFNLMVYRFTEPRKSITMRNNFCGGISYKF